MSEDLKHDGTNVKVYYYKISDFIPDLDEFGKFLDGLESSGEKILSVAPNIGFVDTSWLLGTSFQGVKGFAVVTRKS
jgi:hypothetical protein